MRERKTSNLFSRESLSGRFFYPERVVVYRSYRLVRSPSPPAVGACTRVVRSCGSGNVPRHVDEPCNGTAKRMKMFSDWHRSFPVCVGHHRLLCVFVAVSAGLAMELTEDPSRWPAPLVRPKTMTCRYRPNNSRWSQRGRCSGLPWSPSWSATRTQRNDMWPIEPEPFAPNPSYLRPGQVVKSVQHTIPSGTRGNATWQLSEQSTRACYNCRNVIRRIANETLPDGGMYVYTQVRVKGTFGVRC